jgi:hypothetical protein
MVFIRVSKAVLKAQCDQQVHRIPCKTVYPHDTPLLVGEFDLSSSNPDFATMQTTHYDVELCACMARTVCAAAAHRKKKKEGEEDGGEEKVPQN